VYNPRSARQAIPSVVAWWLFNITRSVTVEAADWKRISFESRQLVHHPHQQTRHRVNFRFPTERVPA